VRRSLLATHRRVGVAAELTQSVEPQPQDRRSELQSSTRRQDAVASPRRAADRNAAAVLTLGPPELALQLERANIALCYLRLHRARRYRDGDHYTPCAPRPAAHAPHRACRVPRALSRRETNNRGVPARSAFRSDGVAIAPVYHFDNAAGVGHVEEPILPSNWRVRAVTLPAWMPDSEAGDRLAQGSKPASGKMIKPRDSEMRAPDISTTTPAVGRCCCDANSARRHDTSPDEPNRRGTACLPPR
jgi:hypothetical protein